jgi:hypothetical protein
MPNFTKEYLN